MKQKDQFKENYQDKTIIHMIINKYLIDDKSYSFYSKKFKSDNFFFRNSVYLYFK